MVSTIFEKRTVSIIPLIESNFRGGLPIRQFRKVEDYVHERFAEDISVEALAEPVDLSPSTFPAC